MLHNLMAAAGGFRPESEIFNDPNAWAGGGGFFFETNAGNEISPTKSLTLDAYFAGLRNISEDIGKMPFDLMERVGERGRRKAREHRLFDKMRWQPNPEMTAMSFKSSVTGFGLGWGAGVAEIERTNSGQVEALWPIHQSRVRLKRDGAGKIVFVIHAEDLNKENVTLPDDNVFFLNSWGPTGHLGYSISAFAAQEVGLGLASQEYASRFFRNDATPGIALTHPGKYSENAMNDLRRMWNTDHAGSGNAKKTAVLFDGVTANAFSIPPGEAQMIETRKFTVEAMARWLRIPQHKIGFLERSTFSNITEQNLEYVTDTLMSWATRWEQEARRKLLTPQEQKTMFFATNFDSLLRGDPVKRTQAQKSWFNMGVISQNDIRAMEDMDQIDDPAADERWIQQNMTTLTKAAEGPQEQPAFGNEPEEEAEALQPLFLQAVERIMNKEKKGVAAKIGKKDSVAQIGAFYETLEANYIEGLLPVAQAYAKQAGLNDPEIEVIERASAFVMERRALAVNDKDMWTAEQEVEALMEAIK